MGVTVALLPKQPRELLSSTVEGIRTVRSRVTITDMTLSNRPAMAGGRAGDKWDDIRGPRNMRETEKVVVPRNRGPPLPDKELRWARFHVFEIRDPRSEIGNHKGSLEGKRVYLTRAVTNASRRFSVEIG